MKDALQKTRKGKRKTERADTKGSKLPDKRGVRYQKVKAHAQEVIESAWVANNSSIQSYEDIPRLLRRETRKKALPSEHFNILDAEDHCTLFIQVTKSQTLPPGLDPRLHEPSPNTSIQHGQPTPNQSPAATECDVQSEGRAEEERDEDVKEEQSMIAPLEGEDGDKFNVNIYPGPEIVKAYYCLHARSYISQEIVDRHRLKSDSADTIFLTWEDSDVSRQADKMKRTRFWVVEGKRLRNDLAIGTEHDQPAQLYDPDDLHAIDEATESEDDEEESEGEDSSQDDLDEEEGVEGDDDDENGSSEEDVAGDEDSECEQVVEDEQASSDDSYELIVSPTRDKAPHPNRGYEVVGKLLYAMIDAANDSPQDLPRLIDRPTSAGKAQLGKSSTKYPNKSPDAKGTNQASRASKSKQPAQQPERLVKKKQVTTQGSPIPSKRRNSAIVSQYSDGSPPSPLSLRRKPKKKG